MPGNQKIQRYIYKTSGVCPAEIHLRVHEEILEDLCFVGGGCPGNSILVSRLLKGRCLPEIPELLRGIDCRQGTSCPDQLEQALTGIQNGTLQPADTFRTDVDTRKLDRVCLIGDLAGNSLALVDLLESAAGTAPDAFYCLGNLTGNSPQNEEVIRILKKKGVQAIQGEADWQYVQGTTPADWPKMSWKARDYLTRVPQLLRFDLAGKKAIAFYGKYLQDLEGYSDYDPYSLELNMICGLSNFMQDESVFPALEAMTPQFDADLILFGQAGKWGHWHIGGKDIVAVGPAWDGHRLYFCLLNADGGTVQLKTTRLKPKREICPAK